MYVYACNSEFYVVNISVNQLAGNDILLNVSCWVQSGL